MPVQVAWVKCCDATVLGRFRRALKGCSPGGLKQKVPELSKQLGSRSFFSAKSYLVKLKQMEDTKCYKEDIKNNTKTNKSSPLTISPAKLDTPEPSSDWVTQRYRSWSWLVTSLRLKEAANRLWLMFFIWATGISSPFLLLITDKHRDTWGATEAAWGWTHTHTVHSHAHSLSISLTAGLKVVTTIEP